MVTNLLAEYLHSCIHEYQLSADLQITDGMVQLCHVFVEIRLTVRLTVDHQVN